jgi:hypothetical protein
MKEDWQYAADFCDKMRDAVGAAVGLLKEELLAGVQSAKTPGALAQALRQLAARQGDRITWNMIVQGAQVYTMEAVASYILAEMLTNSASREMNLTAEANRSAANALSFTSDYVGYKLVAYAVFSYRVGPRMGKDQTKPFIGEWDHKQPIRLNYGMFSYDSMTKRLFFYDIWSNIHYGYVGLAAGFSENELTTGAKAANLASSLGMSILQYGQADDPRDQAAIALGMNLWKQSGPSLDLQSLLDSIRDSASQLTTFECDCFSKGGI